MVDVHGQKTSVLKLSIVSSLVPIYIHLGGERHLDSSKFWLRIGVNDIIYSYNTAQVEIMITFSTAIYI